MTKIAEIQSIIFLYIKKPLYKNHLYSLYYTIQKNLLYFTRTQVRR